MIDFNKFMVSLESDLNDIASDIGEHIKEEFIKDGTAFAEKTKEDLETWTFHLAKGNLCKSDFKFLLRGRKDLAEMEMLKQKGLAPAKIDILKRELLDTVVGSAAKLAGPAN